MTCHLNLDFAVAVVVIAAAAFVVVVACAAVAAACSFVPLATQHHRRNSQQPSASCRCQAIPGTILSVSRTCLPIVALKADAA